MFKLHDIRKTRVWQQAQEEARQEVRKAREIERRRLIGCLRAYGMTQKEIAELLGISLAMQVRRLAKR